MKEYRKASRGDAQVGIWWYTDDRKILAVSKLTDDGELNGSYIQYSSTENHMTLWHKVMKDHMPDNYEDIVKKGYQSFERGKVIYDCRTCCYEVTCSENLIYDRAFRREIIDYFNLRGNQVEFVQLNKAIEDALSNIEV